MKKIVKMICPSCGNVYDEKDPRPVLDLSTGQLRTEYQPNKRCHSCGTGLIRQVTKLDKKGKIR